MSSSPHNLSYRPRRRLELDPLTDLFNTVHVGSVVHAPPRGHRALGLSRGSEDANEAVAHSSALRNLPSQFAHFGMISRGNCWLSVEGMPDPLPLTGGGGIPTTVISGWFSFGQMSVKPLKRLLPELILVKADQAQTLALHATLQLLASEMAEPAPGSDVMVNRLADILFIQCVRAHIASSSENCNSGWLRAIFDPKIGAALKAMHERVENPWTVETLAASAGMSRSAFALRFKELLGETPLEYLTKWRMC